MNNSLVGLRFKSKNFGCFLVVSEDFNNKVTVQFICVSVANIIMSMIGVSLPITKYQKWIMTRWNFGKQISRS